MLSVIFVFVALYVFPLLAWTDADLKKTLALAFVMAFKNFGWTLLMLTSAALFITAALFVFWPLLFVSAGGIAYVHAKILTFVFHSMNGEMRGKMAVITIKIQNKDGMTLSVARGEDEAALVYTKEYEEGMRLSLRSPRKCLLRTDGG